MKEVEVTLAGKKYQVRALPIKQARLWRAQFQAPFEGLVGALQNVGELELTNGAGLATLVSVVSGTLLGSMDLVLEMVFGYAPSLAADRERIEAEAYDEEALAAFIEVLKLAYPFGGVMRLFRG